MSETRYWGGEGQHAFMGLRRGCDRKTLSKPSELCDGWQRGLQPWLARPGPEPRADLVSALRHSSERDSRTASSFFQTSRVLNNTCLGLIWSSLVRDDSTPRPSWEKRLVSSPVDAGSCGFRLLRWQERF